MPKKPKLMPLLLTTLISGSPIAPENPEIEVWGFETEFIANGDDEPTEAKGTLWIEAAGGNAQMQVRNTGDVEISISGVSVPEFWEAQDGDSNPLAFPLSIPASDNISFYLRFTNHASGSYGGTVVISSNAPDYSYAVAAENP